MRNKRVLKYWDKMAALLRLQDMFRNREVANKILKEIFKLDPGRKIKIMHVCGSHEVTVRKYGLRSLLPDWVEIIAGPGCPVCVTTSTEIDEAIELAKQGHTITTFGDMFRVPGSSVSIADAKTEGADVRIIYGAPDAVDLARRNPEKEVVHVAIGFETTAPTIASELLRKPPPNFSLLVCHRLIPPAMQFMLSSGEVGLDGFLCPGHVSTIIGSKPYEPISENYRVPQVIAGFEPIDVLLGVWMLLKQVNDGRHEVEIEYTRSVRPEGNMIAQEKMRQVFEVVDKSWRGFPIIPVSALELRSDFENFDAHERFDISVEGAVDMPSGCKCGEVLRGLIYPHECPMFGDACTPLKPIGPCMVSSEGTCNIAFNYGRSRSS
jgi:hydrogenase expression/formation protein HypD